METFDYKKYAYIAGTLALSGIFLGSLAFGAAELSAIHHPVGQQGTITVSGDGEVSAIPDIATVTYTIRESAATVAQAQTQVETKNKAAIDALARLGVGEKDRKTLSYNVTPKYENVPVNTMAVTMYPVTNQKIVGYEVSETIEAKIRKVDAAGDVLGALGAVNISEISGPTFAIDEPEALQQKAKEEAIAKAKASAEATAKALGMHLGDVVQFSEDNGGTYPMYAKTMSTGLGAGALGPEVTLPQGENTIKSHVSVTYQLN